MTTAILFYCRDCKKIVEGVRKGTKYEYTCPACKSERVVFGTEKAICDFFQVRKLSTSPSINPPQQNA